MTIKLDRIPGDAPPACPCGPRCESCGRDGALRVIVLRGTLDEKVVEFCVTACAMCYGAPSNFRLQTGTIRMITAAHAAQHSHVNRVVPIAGERRASAG